MITRRDLLRRLGGAAAAAAVGSVVVPGLTTPRGGDGPTAAPDGPAELKAEPIAGVVCWYGGGGAMWTAEEAERFRELAERRLILDGDGTDGPRLQGILKAPLA